jgi:hypothetical protein
MGRSTAIDAVPDMEQISRQCDALGSDVTRIRIDAGVRDLVFSPPPVCATTCWPGSSAGAARLPTRTDDWEVI